MDQPWPHFLCFCSLPIQMLAKLKILTSGIRTGIVGIEGGPNDRLIQHEPVGELRDIKSTK